MQRYEALLDVGARAHFLSAAHEHPDHAGADALKEHLFFSVGVCITNGCDVWAWHACLHQLIDNLSIDAIAPRCGVDAHIGEDKLRPSESIGLLPYGPDVLDEGVHL
jgi:hypothetical protein